MKTVIPNKRYRCELEDINGNFRGFVTFDNIIDAQKYGENHTALELDICNKYAPNARLFTVWEESPCHPNQGNYLYNPLLK